MSNPFEDLRQAVVVRPMNSPGPQGAAAPEMKVQYSNDGSSWHNDPVETDRYLSFSTDNGITWSDAIYFNNLSETLDWVEKTRQWAENPENDEVEPGQYSALHHALQAKKSEITAAEYAIDAAGSAAEAFGAAAPAWDSATVYNYNDVVSFDNGHTYRCIGTNVTSPPNVGGVDNEEEWTRITYAKEEDFFEYDANNDMMPVLVPRFSDVWILDENGDIMYQEDVDLKIVEMYQITVDSVDELRSSSFPSFINNIHLLGYYGKGTLGGGWFYKDPESIEEDNGGTIFVDANGIRWKRAGVFEEYYASWFGVSPDVSNNSPMIQNALNVMPPASILIFGPGTYECSDSIVMPIGVGGDYKEITLCGSSKQSHAGCGGYDAPRLLFTNTEGIFVDFGQSADSRFCGTIRNLYFQGPGSGTSTIGLHFNDCVGMILEDVQVMSFGNGIQIDGYYYYSQIVGVRCWYCDTAFKTSYSCNGTVFDKCDFRSSNIGCDCWGYAYFYNCYFEKNQKAIKANVRDLFISGCYFEANHDYPINLESESFDRESLIVIKDSMLSLCQLDIPTTNRAFIKHSLPIGIPASYVIENNRIAMYPADDYFIYYESGGDITIKAENNKFIYEGSFPICSTTPVATQYFNNDFVT